MPTDTGIQLDADLIVTLIAFGVLWFASALGFVALLSGFTRDDKDD